MFGCLYYVSRCAVKERLFERGGKGLQTEGSRACLIRRGASVSQGNDAEEFREELGLLHWFDADGQLYS